mmetsp:Transcript_37745/g.75575  ORF Transcript_37745/g.75575 Transcript_37745/m.75575 type:complete len:201 (-) Transcript_37745:30-632(-)
MTRSPCRAPLLKPLVELFSLLVAGGALDLLLPLLLGSHLVDGAHALERWHTLLVGHRQTPLHQRDELRALTPRDGKTPIDRRVGSISRPFNIKSGPALPDDLPPQCLGHGQRRNGHLGFLSLQERVEERAIALEPLQVERLSPHANAHNPVLDTKAHLLTHEEAASEHQVHLRACHSRLNLSLHGCRAFVGRARERFRCS